MDPIQHIVLHQSQQPPPRVIPQPLPVNPPAQAPRVLPTSPHPHDPRVPPTRPLPQAPRLHPNIPLSDRSPIARCTCSQIQPTLPPPATPARVISHPLYLIKHCTRSRHEAAHVVTANLDASRNYPLSLITNWAMHVRDESSGTSLEYRHPLWYPRYCDT